MFSARLELEHTLEEIVHSIHDDLDEWHPVFDALRNDDGRVDVVIVLVGNDGLFRTFHIACRHTCLKVEGSFRHGAVDIYGGSGRHLSFEIFSLYQSNQEFAHDVLEVKRYW